MYVDTSRARFDQAKHYSAVVLQQGRVILDSDVSEQNAIMAHYLRTVIGDIVGPAGCPKDDAGFGITLIETNKQPDLTIGAGRIYVAGLLVEAGPDDTTYLGQPDGYIDTKLDALPAEGGMVIYLRIWERSVNALQDPDIREVALGVHGPDTTARTKVVWQVAFSPVNGHPAAANAVKEWRSELDALYGPVGRLQARARTPDNAERDVCSISPGALYRGRENQHYRVEILCSGVAAPPPIEDGGAHRAAGAAAAPEAPPVATFVWSRENGSVVFAIDTLAGAEVTLASLGRDIPSGLEVEDWVEIVDDASASRVADENPTGPERTLFQVVAIDPLNCVVTLDRDPGAEVGTTGSDLTRHPLLRRWDSAGSALVREGIWLDLEYGVQVRFSGPDGGPTAQYRSGNYWLAPARTVLADLIWSQDGAEPRAMLPAGITYNYAPLAYIHAERTRSVDDLRSFFTPIAT